MRFIYSITLTLLISQLCGSTPEEKRQKLESDQGGTSRKLPLGWIEIQAINRYMSNLPAAQVARVDLLTGHVIRMLELINEIGPELMEMLDEDQVECPFCGCKFDLLRQMASSLLRSLNTCDTETLYFLQSVIEELSKPQQFLNIIAEDAMDICLETLSDEVGRKIAKSLGKSKSSLFNLIDRLARMRVIQNKDISPEELRDNQGDSLNIVALRSLRFNNRNAQEIAFLLINIAIEDSEKKTADGDLATRSRSILREQLLNPCEEIISNMELATEGFRQFQRAMHILNRALAREQPTHPEIVSEVEIVRICSEAVDCQHSIWNAIGDHLVDRASTSKIS